MFCSKTEDNTFHLPPIGSNVAIKSVSQKNLSKKLQVICYIATTLFKYLRFKNSN